MVSHLFGRMMPSYVKQILHTQLFSVLNIIFGFGTLYILIRYMPMRDYGEYVLVQGFIALFGLIFSQNIYSYARLYIPGSEKLQQYSYLKSVIYIVFIGYFIALGLLLIFNLSNELWTFFEIDQKLGFLVFMMLGLELINLEIMRFFIAIKRIYLKNYAQFFQKIFVLASTIILVYFDYLNLTNFLFIYIFGQVVVFLFFIFHLELKTIIRATFLSDVVKKGYYIAIPLLPVGLMSIALNYTDTLMIAKFIGKEQVAQYGFASQIISIAMMLIGSSIVLTLFPYATEAHNKGDIQLRTTYFRKMLIYSLALALLFYIFIFFGAEYIIRILHLEKYSDVPSYLTVLGLFPLIQIFYNISSHHLQLIKVINIQVYFVLLVMAENFILNYYFIQLYGTIGAAYASLLSYITLSILYMYFSLKHDNTLRSRST